MNLRVLGLLLALTPSSLSATVYVSASGQETYETHTILEPSNNDEVKALLNKAYESMQSNDRAHFPLAVGAGGFWFKDHWQGLAFGAHAHGKTDQPFLNTVRLKKTKLVFGDFQFDPKTSSLSLKVQSGNTLEEVLALANSTLDETIAERFQYFLTGPSSSYITVGGALAAHTHFRSSYPDGGYFLDQIENFTLIAIKDGKATEILCSRSENPDLFHSIPGSFGRGGIITDVTMHLTLMPKDYRVKTTFTKFSDRKEFVKSFTEGIDQLRGSIPANPFDARLIGLNAIMSDRYFYTVRTDFVRSSEVESLPYLDFFARPGLKTFFAHLAEHASPPLGNFVLDNAVFTAKEQSYQNDLIPWLFFHDGYLDFWQNFPRMKYLASFPKFLTGFFVGKTASENIWGKNTMETAHQAYLMKQERFEEFMEYFEKLSKREEFRHLGYKFRDFVPLWATQTLMSPAYSANPKDVFIAVTLSWPVHSDDDKKTIGRLKDAITQLDYVKLHPLKEFDAESTILQKQYAEQAQNLETILHVRNIDDRVIWTKLQKALYGK